MSRTITPSTPKFGEYGTTVHPVVKGGFGVGSEEEIKRVINGADINDTGPGGLVRLDENGKIITDPINKSIDFVTLTGPREYTEFNTSVITITNYTEFHDYVITTENDIPFTRDGAVITLPAGIVDDYVKLIVNGRSIRLTKVVPTSNTPTVVLTGMLNGDGSALLQSSVNAFVGTFGLTCTSIDWTARKGSATGAIIGQSLGQSPNVLNWNYTIPAADVGVVYVSVKFNTNYVGMEKTSVGNTDASTFDAFIGTPAIVNDSELYDLGILLRSTGTAFISSDSSTHKSTQWQISKTADFASVFIDSGQDTYNLLTWAKNIEETNPTYFMRVRYTSSTDKVSKWSNIVTISRLDTFVKGPILESSKISNPITTGTDYYFGGEVAISENADWMLVGSRYGLNGSTYTGGYSHFYKKNGSGTWSLFKTFDHRSIGTMNVSWVEFTKNGQTAINVVMDVNKVIVYDYISNDWVNTSVVTLPTNAAYGKVAGAAITDDGLKLVTVSSQTQNVTSEQGVVYTYTRPNRTSATWTLQGTLPQSSIISDGVATSTGATGYTINAINSVEVTSDGNTMAIFANGTSGTYFVIYKYDTSVASKWKEYTRKLLDNFTSKDMRRVNFSGDGKYMCCTSPGYGGSGAVFLFKIEGTVITELDRRMSPAISGGTAFGISCSASSDFRYIVVGDYKKQNIGNYSLFQVVGDKLLHLHTVMPSNPPTGLKFATRVKISGDGSTIVATTPEYNNNVGSYVYTYTRPTSKFSNQIFRLPPTGTTATAFGRPVMLSADGKRCFVGAHRYNNGKGAAYVFRNDGGIWAVEGNITPSLADNSYFGVSGAINETGDLFVTGAHSVTDTVTSQGKVYVYKRTDYTWSLVQSFVSTVPTAYATFGYFIAMTKTGSRLVVSAPNDNNGGGTVTIYSWNGTAYSSFQRITPDYRVGTEALQFGFNIAMDGDGTTLLVGGYNSTSGGYGTVGHYTWNGSSYVKSKVISGLVAGDWFGYGVTISENGLTAAVWVRTTGKLTLLTRPNRTTDFTRTDTDLVVNGFSCVSRDGALIGTSYLDGTVYRIRLYKLEGTTLTLFKTLSSVNPITNDQWGANMDISYNNDLIVSSAVISGYGANPYISFIN